ncbi:hypothetical protein cce_3442 [Crocosphaera subtropica ATCC 51142]|uniref:Uncharacterized protein n=1 Tax=Crocosphaera subtropica (strain ATCC 51142 / BH68) TaxID=43989 RepID=B1WZ26_CROS5|nr:hypothetical protein cce_3442 [Crocosphaera subtropica ATCC 51142]
MIKVAFFPIPSQYDSGQMLIEAKPEGKLELWKITHLTQE